VRDFIRLPRLGTPPSLESVRLIPCRPESPYYKRSAERRRPASRHEKTHHASWRNINTFTLEIGTTR